MTDPNLIIGMVNERLNQAAQQKADLQQVYYAIGQNLSTAATLEEQGTVQVNGRAESLDSAKVRLQGELEAQQQRQEFARQIDYSALSLDITKEMTATIQKQRQLAASIEADKSVSLFDDPIQALVNSFTLPWDEQALEGTHERLALLSDAATKINAQVSQFSDTTDKLKTSITQSSIDSLTTAIANDQKAKAIRAHTLALQNDAHGIQAISQMDQQMLQTYESGYRIIASEEERGIRREERAFLAEQRAAIAADKQRAKDRINDDVELVKRELARETGAIPFTDDQIRLGLEKNNPIIKKLADRGAVRAMQGGMVSDGEDPLERIEFRRSMGKIPKSDKETLFVQANDAMVNAVPATIKDKAQKGAAAQEALKIQIKKWESDVGSGDKNNPLGLPEFEALATSPAITQNPGYKYISGLVTDTATAKQQVNMQVVYDNLLNAVSNGELRIEDAASLMNNIGMVSKEINLRVGKMYDHTGILQSSAVVAVKPGSLAGQAMRSAGPVITAGGVSSGVGAIPAFAVGAGTSVLGHYMMQGKTDMDLLNVTSIKAAISRGLSNRITSEINLPSKYPEGHVGFYPPLTVDKVKP